MWKAHALIRKWNIIWLRTQCENFQKRIHFKFIKLHSGNVKRIPLNSPCRDEWIIFNGIWIHQHILNIKFRLRFAHISECAILRMYVCMYVNMYTHM